MIVIALLPALAGVVATFAGDSDQAAYSPPKGYICYRVPNQESIVIDGKLDEPVWRAAPWTDEFVDIEGDLKPRPRFRTRCKMLWDDRYFYIAAELEEPHVWATLTKHDSVIFQDNDFEVFIDPDGDNHNYGEFEINALNTGWDLHLPKPYKDGGVADNSWEIAGLKTAVSVVGTLNDPRDIDRGWTVELAFPWESLAKLVQPPEIDVQSGRTSNRVTGAEADAERSPAHSKSHVTPRDGDQWRVNFSRVEWQHEIDPEAERLVRKGLGTGYRKVPNRREDNWVWSPQGVVNMHRPETWGYVQFSAAAAGSDRAKGVAFRVDPAGPARHLLHRVYYAQHEFRKEHGRFAGTLDELGLGALRHESLAGPLTMQISTSGFEVSATVRKAKGSTERWYIRQDSRVWSGSAPDN